MNSMDQLNHDCYIKLKEPRKIYPVGAPEEMIDILRLKRTFATLPAVGDSVLFNVSCLEYELSPRLEDFQVYAIVVRVVHKDNSSYAALYCEEDAKWAFHPSWAP